MPLYRLKLLAHVPVYAVLDAESPDAAVRQAKRQVMADEELNAEGVIAMAVALATPPKQEETTDA